MARNDQRETDTSRLPDMPVYQKPEKPGIVRNADRSVSLYLVVGPDETFVQAAERLFTLVRQGASQYPGLSRVLYVDIKGHEGPRAGFDPDFFEFQQEFVFSTVAPFLTAMSMPLVSALNPDRQREDLPDGIKIGPPPQDDP